MALRPDEPEIEGLLSLMLLHHARRLARIGEGGAILTLEKQDRGLWDRAVIDEGVALIERALKRGGPGPYQLQAAVIAVHAEARSFAETDWRQIALLYGELARTADNPVYELNRIVALSYFEGAAVLCRTGRSAGARWPDRSGEARLCEGYRALAVGCGEAVPKATAERDRLAALRHEDLHGEDREHAGEGIVHAAQHLPVVLQPACQPVGCEHDECVHRHADQDEEETEEQQLIGYCRVAGGDELRQEGHEEDDDLRVQQVHPKAAGDVGKRCALGFIDLADGQL
ncbi:conserved hypothetical protein [Ricinus communis]|uniref:DUF6596 domain-containing protein n=1 Tax=Ricinus communis TaxID=3988 RepID=B9TLE7_RICCO|nr:conserved hypothetical protein [Ricinus communis]